MNAIGYFEIQSSNPQREKDFYERVFQWKFIKIEHAPIEYYHIETPGLYGGLMKRPADTPSLSCGTNSFTCSIEVENFDKTAEIILEAGGKVAMPKFAVPNRCWQGYFLDPDNNTFGIFEVDENVK